VVAGQARKTKQDRVIRAEQKEAGKVMATGFDCLIKLKP
jgi:hypothetical protein